MRAGTTPWVRARMVTNEVPRNPPIWGIRLTTAYQTAATGASGTPTTSPTMRTQVPPMQATSSDPAK